MALKAEIQSNLPKKIKDTLGNFWAMSLIFSTLMLLLRQLELFLIFKNYMLEISFREVILQSLLSDINWILYFLGLLFIVHLVISLFSAKIAKWTTQLALVISILGQVALVLYFTNTLVPLGTDVLAYNLEEILITVKASGQLNFLTMTLGALLFLGITFILNIAAFHIKLNLKTSLIYSICMYWFLILFYFLPIKDRTDSNETKANIQANKSNYLADKIFDHYMYANEYYFDFYLRSANNGLLVNKEFPDPNYPFLNRAEYPDVLSPFFDSLSSKPNFVFIFMESLGKAYSGKNALLGSFTPFLDSLEQHSLVWTNNISSTGRTFGLLPGVFGGLPYGDKGFLEMSPNFPHHSSLLSILHDNGYESHFFMGTDITFDHEDSFLKYHGVKSIHDIHDFDPKYPRIASENGFSWGYNDKEMFANALEKLSNQSVEPHIRIFQTITTHNPYNVPNPDFYKIKFEKHIKEVLRADAKKQAEYRAYANIYYTVLYADDAVKGFINEYTKRPEFENTIFIITGDHRLPEIPMASRLDRFHVPLIIYSPLIKDPTYFQGMTSHFEITPSLLALLEAQNGINVPEEVVWQGQVLDTAQEFSSQIAMPLMRNKNQLVDYVSGNYFLSENQVFVISDGLNIDLVDDQLLKNKLTGEFEDFKNKNNYTYQTRLLLPKN